MASLKSGLAAIGEGEHRPLALRASFGGRIPRSLSAALAGMSDPAVGAWQEVGVALSSENTTLSEEAQGATTDGAFWYVCSNELKGVVTFADDGTRVRTVLPTAAVMEQMWQDAGSPAPASPPLGDSPWQLAILTGTWSPHFGAPGHSDGWIHVPIQGPRGVWRHRVDGSQQHWRLAQTPAADASFPSDDLFAWCDVHPVSGRLYTCNYERPDRLLAYDRGTLLRHPADDIPLRDAPFLPDRIQGAVFTSRGRVILVRWDPNALYCYSSLNGHFFGAKNLGDFDSDFSEVESVAVRSWKFGSVAAQVHILELDNDASLDDFYLHSFRVPEPSKL